MKSDAIKPFFVLGVTQIGRRRLSYKLYLKAQRVYNYGQRIASGAPVQPIYKYARCASHCATGV